MPGRKCVNIEHGQPDFKYLFSLLKKEFAWKFFTHPINIRVYISWQLGHLGWLSKLVSLKQLRLNRLLDPHIVAHMFGVISHLRYVQKINICHGTFTLICYHDFLYLNVKSRTFPCVISHIKKEKQVRFLLGDTFSSLRLSSSRPADIHSTVLKNLNLCSNISNHYISYANNKKKFQTTKYKTNL